MLCSSYAHIRVYMDIRTPVTLLLIALLPGCLGNKVHLKSKKIPIAVQKKSPHQREIHTLTIWVHGSSFLGIQYLHKCTPGLHCAKTIEETGVVPTNGHLHKLAKAFCHSDPERFSLDRFFFYGWSGKVNFASRREEAVPMYHALKQEREKYYKKHGVMPRLRLMCHSHGGNLALNIAHAAHHDQDFCVDELILFACPVQRATSPLVHHRVFRRIYSIYSNSDIVQVLDPQGFYPYGQTKLFKEKNAKRPLFSERHFPANEKLMQTSIRIRGKTVGHSDFIFAKFYKHIPQIIDELDAWIETDYSPHAHYHLHLN